MYGGKFGGNFIPETLKKPIDDLTKLFAKLRKDKKFLKERDYYFKNYIGTPTPFIKLRKVNKIFRMELKSTQKLFPKRMEGLTKFITLLFIA